MTHMQWPGGIGRDKLDLNFFTLAHFADTEAVATIENGANHIQHSLLVNEEIDKAGSGNFDLGDMIAWRQRIDLRLREFARILASRLGQHQRDITGEVAMGGIAGTGNLDIWRQRAFEHALLLQRTNSLADQVFNRIFQRTDKFV